MSSPRTFFQLVSFVILCIWSIHDSYGGTNTYELLQWGDSTRTLIHKGDIPNVPIEGRAANFSLDSSAILLYESRVCLLTLARNNGSFRANTSQDNNRSSIVPVMDCASPGDPSCNGVCDANDSASGPDCNGICESNDSPAGPDCDGICDANDRTAGPDCNGICDSNDSGLGPDCNGRCDPGDASSSVDCDGACDAFDIAGSPDCDGFCDVVIDAPNGPDCAPLPAELLRFTGQVNACKLKFQWETASEMSVSHFLIVGIGAGDAVELAQIPATGSVDKPSKYSFELSDATTSSELFRLITVDLDGSREESAAIHVDRVDCGEPYTFHVEPGKAQVELRSVALEKFGQIRVISLTSGRAVPCTVEVLDNGVDISTRGLSDGIYLLQVDMRGRVNSHKFIKL